MDPNTKTDSSDDDSLEIVHFGNSFSPFKSDLERQFFEEDPIDRSDKLRSEVVIPIFFHNGAQTSSPSHDLPRSPHKKSENADLIMLATNLDLQKWMPKQASYFNTTNL